MSAGERDRTPAARPADELERMDPHERTTLVELVNRVLDKGVIVTGEVVIGIGGVDLVYLGLQLVLSSIDTLEKAPGVRSMTLPPRSG